MDARGCLSASETLHGLLILKGLELEPLVPPLVNNLARQVKDNTSKYPAAACVQPFSEGQSQMTLLLLAYSIDISPSR